MVKIVYNACFGGFSLSHEAMAWLDERGMKLESSYDCDKFDRHNPLLVECIETLGAKANGMCAELAVAKIKGNRYRIEEYDGQEMIATPETEYWVTVE